MTQSTGKTLRVGVLAGIHNLDPQKAQDVDSLFVLRQIVEAPFATQPGTTELEPALFASGLESAGGEGLVYRAGLKDGLLLSDGSPLTARQVAECLQKVSLITEQAEVEHDGNDVVFRLRGPNPRFDVALSHPQCTIYDQSGGKLLGTGAFQLADDSRPDRIHLVRNPHHREVVAIDEVYFEAYPLDDAGRPTALLAAIEAGEVDYAYVLSRDDINRLGGVKKSILPGISTAMLYLNTQSPKLADPRLRQAIGHAIDRIEVARTSYSNALAFAAPSLLPRALGAADDGLDYDPSKARELLSAVGDAKPDKLSLLMMWGPRPYLPQPQKFLEVIRGCLEEIGITVEAIPTADSVDYLEKVMAGKHDMMLSGWIADVMDPADYLEANLASNRVPSPGNISHSSNCGRLENPEMDRALATFRSERTTSALEEVLRLLTEQAPLVPLAYGPTTAVLSFRVGNFKPSPLSILPLGALDLAG